MLENKTIYKINDPSTDLLKDIFVTMSAIIDKDKKQFK